MSILIKLSNIYLNNHIACAWLGLICLWTFCGDKEFHYEITRYLFNVLGYKINHLSKNICSTHSHSICIWIKFLSNVFINDIKLFLKLFRRTNVKLIMIIFKSPPHSTFLAKNLILLHLFCIGNFNKNRNMICSARQQNIFCSFYCSCQVFHIYSKLFHQFKMRIIIIKTKLKADEFSDCWILA